MFHFLALSLGLCALVNAAITLIETPDDLKALANAEEGGYYALANNLELTDWEPILGFGGVLYGGMYTITVKSFKPDADDGYVGIFWGLSGATIQDLKIVLDNIELTSASFAGRDGIEGLMIGTLAAGAQVSHFSNVYVSGKLNLTLDMEDTKLRGEVYVGGLVGMTDAISGVTNEANITVNLTKATVPVYVGGLAGVMMGDGTGVATTGVSVYSDIISCEAATCYVGGLAGTIMNNIIMGADINVGTIAAMGADAEGTHYAAGVSPLIMQSPFSTGFGDVAMENRVQLSRVAADVIMSTYMAAGVVGEASNTVVSHSVVKVDAIQADVGAAGCASVLQDNSLAEYNMIQVSRISIESTQADKDSQRRDVAGFVGTLLNGSSIRDSYATIMYFDPGMVTNANIGGFVGYMRASTIYNSYAYLQRLQTDIVGNNVIVGGFVGTMQYQYSQDRAKHTGIDASFALVGSANIRIMPTGGYTDVAGFVGYMNGDKSAQGDDGVYVQNSYTSFTLNLVVAGTTGSTLYFGGFVGGTLNDGTVMNCYAVGATHLMQDGTMNALYGQFSGANGKTGTGTSLRLVDCMSFVNFRDSLTNDNLARGFFGYYTKIDNATSDIRGNYMVNFTEDSCQYRPETPEAVVCVSPEDVTKISSYPLRRFGATYAWSMSEGQTPRLTSVPNPTNMFYQLTDVSPVMVVPSCSYGRCFDFNRVWNSSFTILPSLQHDTPCFPDCSTQSGAGNTYYKNMRTCTCVEGCIDLVNGVCLDGEGHALCSPGYSNGPFSMLPYDTCSYYSCTSDNAGNVCNFDVTGATCVSSLDLCACPKSTQWYNPDTKQCEDGCEHPVVFGVCIGGGMAVCTEERFGPIYDDDSEGVALCSVGSCNVPDYDDPDNPFGIPACGDVFCDPMSGACVCPSHEDYWDADSQSCQPGCPNLVRGYCIGPNNYACEPGSYTNAGDEFACYNYDCRKATDNVCGGAGTCNTATGECTCNEGSTVLKYGGTCVADGYEFLCPMANARIVNGDCVCNPGWHTENPSDGFCMQPDCEVFDDEPFPIYDEDSLREMILCPGRYYLMTEDVVLSEPWPGIANFSGTLVGDGHKISNITFDLTSNSRLGFINTLAGGSLIGLQLDFAADVTLSTGTVVAAIAEARFGNIAGLYVTGRINVTYTGAKGIATVGCVAGLARNMSSTIGECDLTCTAPNGGTCIMGGHSAVARVSSGVTTFIRSYSNVSCTSEGGNCIVGGIFAQSYNPIEGGYFAGSLYVSASKLTEVGGVCAHCQSDMRAVFAHVHNLTAFSENMLFASGFAATIRYNSMDLCSAQVDYASIQSMSRGSYGGLFAESALGGIEVQNCYATTAEIVFYSDAWVYEGDETSLFGACFGGLGGHLGEPEALNTVVVNSYAQIGKADLYLTDTNVAPMSANDGSRASDVPLCNIGGFIGNVSQDKVRLISGDFSWIQDMTVHSDQRLRWGGFVGEMMTAKCALANCYAITLSVTFDTVLEGCIAGVGGLLGELGGSTFLQNNYAIASRIHFGIPEADDLTGVVGAMVGYTKSKTHRTIKTSIVDASFSRDKTEISDVPFYTKGDNVVSSYMRCDRPGVVKESPDAKKFTCTDSTTAYKKATYEKLDFEKFWATPGGDANSPPYLRIMPNPNWYDIDNGGFMIGFVTFNTSSLTPVMDPQDPYTPWDYENHWSMLSIGMPRFLIQDGNCSRIHEDCMECFEGKCTACNNNMVVSANGFTCLPPECSVAHCLICNDDGTCYQCETSYKPMNGGFECAKPDCKKEPNCATCDFANQNTDDTSITCASCVGGYTLVGGSCYRNDICKESVANCQTCSGSDPRECGYCQTGYDLTDLKKCIPVCQSSTSSYYIENCATCNSADTTLCSSCVNGYELASGNKECRPACMAPGTSYYDPNCASCKATDTTKCDQCNSGYVVDPANANLCTPTCRASSAANPVANCLACSTSNPSQCISCEAGYFLNAGASANGVCEPACISEDASNTDRVVNCVACSASQPFTCSECREGFQLSTDGRVCNGMCLSDSGTADAIPNCVRCDTDTGKSCVQCRSGYMPTSDGRACTTEGGNLSSGLSGGAIAGIVIAVLIILAVAGFLVYWFVFRKRGGFSTMSDRKKRSKAVLPSAVDNNSLMTESDSRMAAF